MKNVEFSQEMKKEKNQVSRVRLEVELFAKLCVSINATLRKIARHVQKIQYHCRQML